jgi:hypothetical protein
LDFPHRFAHSDKTAALTLLETELMQGEAMKALRDCQSCLADEGKAMMPRAMMATPATGRAAEEGKAAMMATGNDGHSCGLFPDERTPDASDEPMSALDAEARFMRRSLPYCIPQQV